MPSSKATLKLASTTRAPALQRQGNSPLLGIKVPAASLTRLSKNMGRYRNIPNARLGQVLEFEKEIDDALGDPTGRDPFSPRLVSWCRGRRAEKGADEASVY